MNDQVPFVSQPPPARETIEGKTIGGSMQNTTKETTRFQKAKAKALEDNKIKGLQDKADSAATDDAHRKASKEYYKALYSKMRKVDPSLKDQIDRTENATMKMLDRKSIGGGDSDDENDAKSGENENTENKTQEQNTGDEAQ